MALLGDLVVTLEADSTRFEKGMDRSRKQLNQFEKSTASAFLSSNKFRGGLTQASFAVDDFAGVLAAGGGFGAALRSTSNNIGTLVTAINPIAGIATTLGIIIGSTLIPKLFSAGEAAGKAAKDFETFEERMRRVRKEQDRLKQITAESVRIITLFDSEVIDAEVDRIEAELKKLERDREFALRLGFRDTKAEQEIARLNAQLERLGINQGLADFNRELERMDELNRISEIESLDTLNDRLEESRRSLEGMQREMQAIARQLGILEELDPTGNLPDFAELFEEQDRRLQQMKDLREQIDALEGRRDELNQQAAGVAIAAAAAGTVAATAAGLPTTADRKVEVIEDRVEQDRFAGFAERGSAAAFSAILKATRPDQQSKSLASIEKTNKTIAKSGADTAKAVGKIAAGAGNEVRLIVVDSFT